MKLTEVHVGDTLYAASDIKYYGKVTVTEIRPTETVHGVPVAIVSRSGQKGRVCIDQLHSTMREAKDKATHHILYNR